jgi:rfaE bifunctional protein nucleotidyltransferase chain/domain
MTSPSAGDPGEFLRIEDKLCTTEALLRRLPSLPRPLVFTNGVFDVLHRGHVTYLQSARALGASLLVAINTDRSVRGLGKGLDRPINSEQDRAVVMAALASVSAVTSFDEPDPMRLLQWVRPDLYVKGGDYRIEDLAEARLVQSWGGECVILPFVDGYSTTDLVRRVRAEPGALKGKPR